VAEIPEADRSSRGKHLPQLLGLGKGDRIRAMVAPARQSKDDVLVFVTEQGSVKRTPLEQFGSQRSGGVNAIGLRDGDRLLTVGASDGSGDLVLVTREGRGIRFAETEVPEMGRTAQGVRGVKVGAGDRIVGAAVVRREGTLCGTSERGHARAIDVHSVPRQKRDGKGVTLFRTSDASGPLVDAREVREGEELMMVSPGGSTIGLRVDDVTRGAPGDPVEKVVTMPGGARIAEVTGVGYSGAAARPAATEIDGDEIAPPHRVQESALGSPAVEGPLVSPVDDPAAVATLDEPPVGEEETSAEPEVLAGEDHPSIDMDSDDRPREQYDLL
jgi:DNA gyrase subunit A